MIKKLRSVFGEITPKKRNDRKMRFSLAKKINVRNQMKIKNHQKIAVSPARK